MADGLWVVVRDCFQAVHSLGALCECRYVTPGGFRESGLVAGLRGEALESVEKRLRARLHLYSPGGRLACELAKNPTVLIINDTVFAHGGVLPNHGALFCCWTLQTLPSQSMCSHLIVEKLDSTLCPASHGSIRAGRMR